jgi:hypothetical protein
MRYQETAANFGKRRFAVNAGAIYQKPSHERALTSGREFKIRFHG